MLPGCCWWGSEMSWSCAACLEWHVQMAEQRGSVAWVMQHDIMAPVNSMRRQGPPCHLVTCTAALCTLQWTAFLWTERAPFERVCGTAGRLARTSDAALE
jgi:hypothetical protein